MGSWHGTCGLTQLPIKQGDKVVLIVLSPNPSSREDMSTYGGGICYSNDLYQPITPPIVGRYNDYGRVTKFQDIRNANLIFEFINERYNSEITKAVEKGATRPTDIEEMIKFIERGEIPLSFIMFEEEIFRKVIKEFGNRKIDEDDDTSIREFIQKIALDGVVERRSDPNPPRFLISLDDQFSDCFSPKMNFFLLKLFDDNINLTNSMIDLCLIQQIFDYSRRLWIPQCGKGSQRQEFMIAKVIANHIIKKEKKVRTERLEEEELDPVEDKKYIENITREPFSIFF